MTALRDVLFVSDLDGTLLDHQTYSWSAATQALDTLREQGAALVLASSKTAAEVVRIRDHIGFSQWPSIVENGSGLLEPGAEPMHHDDIYAKLRRVIAQLPEGFRGFGDMTDAEVAAHTGLSRVDAGRARARGFSEPGLWTGEPGALNAFLAAARAAGLTAQQGGRFLTLSFGGTKAERLKQIIARLTPNHTIVLGDAPNDIDMIQMADTGVIVANPSSPVLPNLPGEDTGRIRRTERQGPAGWSDAVLEIIQQLHDTKDKRAHG